MAETQLRSILGSYVDRVLEALPDDRQPGRVVRVAPGVAPAFDDCCEGQLYTRVVSMVPAVEKVPNGAGVRCNVPAWSVTIGLGMIRCAHTLDDHGDAPAADLVTEDGYEMLDDMLALQEAILHDDAPTRSVLGWNPLEEEGGCHGGEWLFTLRLDLVRPGAYAGPAGLGG